MIAGERTAHMYEEFDRDERGLVLTGRFHCEVGTAHQELLTEHADAALEWADALAWCRERADRVTVRLGNTFYSAGRVPGSEPPVDETLEFARRRFPGWEFLDLTADDPPISWDIVVSVDPISGAEFATSDGLTSTGVAWAGALRSSQGLQVVWLVSSLTDEQVVRAGGAGPWTRYPPELAVLRLEAPGYEAAVARATAAVADAAAAAGWSPPPRFAPDDVFATGSDAAHRGVRFVDG